MNILHTETATFTQDSFGIFSWVNGPGTVVNLIFGDLDVGETLTVYIFGKSDLVIGTPTDYVLEEITIPAAASEQTGFQSTPVPMPNDQWAVAVGARVSGGSLDRQFRRVAILL